MSDDPGTSERAFRHGRWRRPLLIGLVVVVLVLAVVLVVIGTTTQRTAQKTTPAGTVSPSNTSGELPISVASNSDPGVHASSCDVNSTGSEVIGVGTFNPPIPYAGSNLNLQLAVFDSHGVNVTNSDMASGTSPGTGDGQWRVVALVESGFQPAQCVIGLYGNEAPPQATTTTIPSAINTLEQQCEQIGGTFATDSPVLGSGQTPYACRYYDTQVVSEDDLVLQNAGGTYSYDSPLPTPTPLLTAVNAANTDCNQHGGVLVYADYLSPPEYECTANGANGIPLTINNDGSWSWQSPLP